MPSQTDSTGLIIHNSVINLEPIRLEYSPFADDLSSFINNFKQGWYSDQPYISIDGITAEEAIALFIAYMNTTDFLNFIRRYIRSDVFGLDSQETMTLYVKNLEEKGFSVEKLTKDKSLQKEFRETDNEKSIITQSLEQFQEFCKNPENKMPANIFEDFAKDINLKTTPRIEITPSTKISKT
jgi:hypothetical protein